MTVQFSCYVLSPLFLLYHRFHQTKKTKTRSLPELPKQRMPFFSFPTSLLDVSQCVRTGKCRHVHLSAYSLKHHVITYASQLTETQRQHTRCWGSLVSSSLVISSSTSASEACSTCRSSMSCSSLVLKSRRFPSISGMWLITCTEIVRLQFNSIKRIAKSYLVSISLVDQETLALPRVRHLKRVLWNQRVEEGVVRVRSSFLCPENAAESLSLLSSGSAMRGDLDEDIGFREIEWRISYLNRRRTYNGNVIAADRTGQTFETNIVDTNGLCWKLLRIWSLSVCVVSP